MEKMTRGCVRCHKLFQYGDMNKSLRGQMTRRYCDMCKILQHRDESRAYSLKYGRTNRKSQYMKEYYQKNKEIILKRAGEWNKRNKEARKLIVEREKRSKLKPFWEVKPTK